MDNSRKFANTISNFNQLTPQLRNVKNEIESLINQRKYFIKGVAGVDTTNKLYELISYVETAESRMNNQIDSMRQQKRYHERQEEIEREREERERRERLERRREERRRSYEEY